MGYQGQNEDDEKTEPDETRAEKVEGVVIHVLSHLQSCAGPKSLRRENEAPLGLGLARRGCPEPVEGALFF